MYSGFDRLTPPAPRKPPPDQPEEDTYSHLTVAPGKENSPQSSPGSSHSASPAAMPAANPVILSFPSWLMLSSICVCVCVCVCAYRNILTSWQSHCRTQNPTHLSHPSQTVMKFIGVTLHPSPHPEIMMLRLIASLHLLPSHMLVYLFSTYPHPPLTHPHTLSSLTPSSHSHPPLTTTLPSRAPYLPAVNSVLMLFHLLSH